MLTTLAVVALAPRILFVGGLVYDGSGGTASKVDVAVQGGRIAEVGHLRPRVGDILVKCGGLAVAPGFIDAHSHASGKVFDEPDAESQIRQGITTAVVGEDGGSELPVSEFFAHLAKSPASLNFASFVGHGTIRQKVIGDADRAPTPEELEKMKALVGQAMADGALGLSTGLEYVPNRYAKTDEVVELAKVAAQHGGIYISHMRNEDNQFFDAFNELLQVAKQAGIPAQVNHIKLGSSRVWGQADKVGQMIQESRREGLDISADEYPYTYWQSTIRVLIATEQFDDRKQWEQGLSDVGGPGNVLLSRFTPDPSWEGKTIAELAKDQKKDAINLIQEIIRRTSDGKGKESVVVTAMSERDVEAFMRNPNIAFCSDGAIGGSHPRGAGAFPRVLGVYVRERRVIPLAEAIRKMTSLSADRFGFADRGRIAVGKAADIVVFDPRRVKDMATTKNPTAPPVGIPTVMVNGEFVLRRGKVTHAHPGQVVKKNQVATNTKETWSR